MPQNPKRMGVLGLLICLTALLVFAQSAFFFVHYQGASILDSLASTSIIRSLLLPVVYLPILGFLAVHLSLYMLWTGWVWFVAVSLGELFKLSSRQVYWAGAAYWLSSLAALYGLNAYYFPHSYFADIFFFNQIQPPHFPVWLALDLINLLLATLLAYANFFWFKRIRVMGIALLAVVVAMVGVSLQQRSMRRVVDTQSAQPNVIIIGLDSLRPDHVGYFNGSEINTPNLDAFLQSASVFTKAYTPLARTFPSWVSMLTSKYPIHHYARVNLADPEPITANNTLAAHLRSQGYFTIYGSDETRFTDITRSYGFDRIIGAPGGAAEFLLAGLNDFPLTNLLLRFSRGKYLLPYQFGNRSAEVSYDPDSFLQLVEQGLASRPHQPVFLALHLCLTHWPFTWAQDGFREKDDVPYRYRHSIQAEDAQLGELLKMLQSAGLLQHSIVVLMSDHGVTLGMPKDRVVSEKKYRGDKSKMKLVSKYKFGAAPDFSLNFKSDYSINTSYGQGTDVLSEKQYHVLLAIRGYGLPVPAAHIDQPSMLLDVAPTLLDYLKLPAMQKIDGMPSSRLSALRPIFIETGDKIAEIEKNKIDIEQVLKKVVSAYEVNPQDGLMRLTKVAQKNMIENKQHAIFYGDWLLAHYPAERRNRIVFEGKPKKAVYKPVTLKPYYVLVNLKTGEWTIDMLSDFAKRSPLVSLKRQLRDFYGAEIKDPQ